MDGEICKLAIAALAVVGGAGTVGVLVAGWVMVVGGATAPVVVVDGTVVAAATVVAEIDPPVVVVR